MKSFFKYTFATILGLFLFMILSLLIFGGIISAVISASDKEVTIEDKSLLELKLDKPILDRASNDPFQDFDIPGFQNNKKLGLDEILSAIKKAKSNNQIKGIYLHLSMIPSGYATIEEIRTALIDFKSSGKFIYAYSEFYDQKAYYLASAADKIFINPRGELMLTGIGTERSFYKKALDKLGIEMQVIRHGKFKSAVEPFILDKMSPENREQTQVYIGSIWSNMVSKISKSRNISTTKLNELANQNMLFQKGEVYVQNKLVDSLVYEDQLLDIFRAKLDIKKDKGIPIASVSDLKKVPEIKATKGLAKDKIAVIYAIGEIGMTENSGMGSDEGIDSREMAREVRKARIDTTIKAIVLRINSPGGSALGSELIWREVKLAAAEKPLIVSMGNVAASGGYYIAAAADTIVADPTTITGSIGIFGLIPNVQKLFSDKLGITTDVVKTNDMSDMPSIMRPLTKSEMALLQNMIEDGYSTFVNRVAEGRKMTFEQVDEIGQGRVWTGDNAIGLGLVDVLGDLNDAINIAKDKAGLKEYRVVNFPKQKDPFEELFKGFSTQIKAKVIENEFGEAARYYSVLQDIQKSKGVMARLPYDMVTE